MLFGANRAGRGGGAGGRGAVAVMLLQSPADRATTCALDVNVAADVVRGEQGRSRGGHVAPQGDTFMPAVAEAMRAELSSVAERTVAAIVVEVPGYAEAFRGTMRRTLENAQHQAVRGRVVR